MELERKYTSIYFVRAGKKTTYEERAGQWNPSDFKSSNDGERLQTEEPGPPLWKKAREMGENDITLKGLTIKNV